MTDKDVHVDETVDKPSMYTGASRSVPDFSGKITGRNAPENNWEDQRSIDRWTGSLFEIDSGNYNRPIRP